MTTPRQGQQQAATAVTATTSAPAAATPDFTVIILACGLLRDGQGIVYAVAVSQPVQSWTVLRSHDDFVTVGNALSQTLTGIPECPPLNDVSINPGTAIVEARNELQSWLSKILMYPGAREAQAIRDFLTLGANTILPQYEGIAWTQFNTAPLIPAVSAATHHHHQVSSPSSQQQSGPVDDMEMDDMFLEGEAPHHDVEESDDDDGGDNEVRYEEDYIPSASERYKQTNEAVSDQDELDVLQGDVIMIEDIGSLAQSLGASHLGRSLNLQAEMKYKSSSSRKGNFQAPKPQVQGLNIGQRGVVPQQQQPSAGGGGGIGGAMAKAAINNQSGVCGGTGKHNTSNSNNSFNRRPLESAPRLDSFKMIRVIGKGSFGKVFLVREIKTAQIYALKVLRKDNIIKRNQVEHTKTERNVLGYVKHPFIVGMNMAFQSKDKLYFVLDYCAGGELFFHLGQEGRFPELRARFYAAEIISAISYVHSLDIIYRDLKPENVLLDAEGHIRLTDFGLSKEGISNSSSGAYSFCGTPEYLAPEILNRQGHGRAVDWWSLGALLYEMLTGLPPFYCQDRERLFEKIRKSELKYPPSVSRPAAALLKGLLTKDPARRLGSGPKDADDIKVHEFFSPINWDKLMEGEVTPPWRPNISGILDTSQFDKEFTNMPVFSPHSMQRAHGFGATPVDTHFEGFTFTDRLLHGPGTHT